MANYHCDVNAASLCVTASVSSPKLFLGSDLHQYHFFCLTSVLLLMTEQFFFIRTQKLNKSLPLVHKHFTIHLLKLLEKSSSVHYLDGHETLSCIHKVMSEMKVLKLLCVLVPCSIVQRCFLLFSLLIYGRCRTISVSNFLVHRGSTLNVNLNNFCEIALCDILNVIDCFFCVR